ncbi:hypothetical protein E4U14_000176, partial [Claviceps sp. LM454 group G7]
IEESNGRLKASTSGQAVGVSTARSRRFRTGFRNEKEVYSHLKSMQRHMYNGKTTFVSFGVHAITINPCKPPSLESLFNSGEALEAVTVSPDVTTAMLTTEAGKAVRKLVLDIDWWSEVQGVLTMVESLLDHGPFA